MQGDRLVDLRGRPDERRRVAPGVRCGRGRAPSKAACLADWVNRRQGDAIEYLLEENRVLREHLGKRRLPFTNAQRRRLAKTGKPLGRKRLAALASLVTPQTTLRWYRNLIASKYDGNAKRGPGRPSGQ